ncbi:MAG: AbrB/MazE/SpoVT family DNA-binding domain-containing protein [Chloroflexota bacterium]|nr:AbrB/MazE/SpoVT family DNA-binding domain-containing protein [Chloroflexota bacterium]
MNNIYHIQVGRRGVVTFPKELRDERAIADGDMLTLFEVAENVFVISKQRTRFDGVAEKLAKEWQDSGESLDSMLSTLRDVRAAHAEDPS